MSFVDIHSCSQFCAENATLRKKVHLLKQQRNACRKELAKLQEEKKLESLLKTYVTSRDVYVQTEPKSWQLGIFGSPRKKEEKVEHVADLEKTNKLLTMHNQLMRRYEKEVKQNMSNIELLSELNLKLAAMETKLKEEKEKVLRLERELIITRGPKSRSRSGAGADDEVLREVVKERNKLKKENKKLRTELKGLDTGFFEEIEDIKFAFQQSAKLNKEYEKALRKLCHQFGVPYPCPEKTLSQSLVEGHSIH
ncbi:centrosomal protein of 290 kDa-like isoform X2 [Gigantopelta aegis]|uniref:centrosomal protein of 290 kDa-like isoform X2 n=1 Tax=Gigantopelta aegis TaxID=1735272 RepID=UPI001B8878C9|nr:centrosomal protein of 290 kDa-like isoform X2 [Gigantopelta aegis]